MGAQVERSVSFCDFTVTRDVALAELAIDIYDTIYVGYGSSKRNPIDSPDQELAQLLTAARAAKDLAKELQKAANILENTLASQAAALKPPKVVGGTQHPSLLNPSKVPTKPSQPLQKAKAKRVAMKA